jgi:hypothetical protein
MHWLTNQREADVAFLEGRTPNQIPRKALGIKDDPIIVQSEEEANTYPPGTWVQMGSMLGVIE